MSAETTIPDASTLHTTEQDLLDSIDQLQGANSDALIIPMTAINEAIASLVDKNSALIGKLQSKILRKLDHSTTKNLDALDGVYTRVLAGLDAYQFDAHHLLEQLAAKGGFTDVGAPLETALIEEVTKAPELAYAGTLVLAVKEAIPYFEELIDVLREIRDRLGERPAVSQAKLAVLPASDGEDAETIAADPPVGRKWV